MALVHSVGMYSLAISPSTGPKVSLGLTFCIRSRSLPLILRIPFLCSRTVNDDRCQKGNSRELIPERRQTYAERAEVGCLERGTRRKREQETVPSFSSLSSILCS